MIRTSETNERADLIKTGKDGRIRYSAAQKRRVLELCKHSISGHLIALVFVSAIQIVIGVIGTRI